MNATDELFSVALHFLWQGCLVASGLALALQLGRGWGASFRYWACCAALAVMVLLPVATYAVLADGDEGRVITYVSSLSTECVHHGASPSGTLSDPLTAATAKKPEVWTRLLWIAWGAGIVVLSLRLIGGAWFASRTASRRVAPVDETWRRKLEMLAHQLGITRPVWLLRSSRIASPRVVGWLRPVVLVPNELCTGLDEANVEALLIHELAHVRRRDYLVNFVQCLIEVVFFFHPAVWWLCARIRVEREHCCDDIAVQNCGDARVYSRALLEIETLRDRRLGMAVGVSGGDLLQRVRRVLLSDPEVPRPALPALLLIATLGVAAIGAAHTEGPEDFTQRRVRVGNPEALESRADFELATRRSVSVHGERLDLIDVLDRVSRQSGLVFDVPANIGRMTVSVDVENVELRRFVEGMLSRKELSCEFDRERSLVVAQWWEAPGPANKDHEVTVAALSAWEELVAKELSHIDYCADGKTLSEVLGELSERHGIRFANSEDFSGHRASGTFEDASVFSVFEELVNRHGFTTDYDVEGVVHIIPRADRRDFMSCEAHQEEN